MEDKPSHTKTVQKSKNPRKFYTHFIFKAAIITIILVVIPVFPSEAPDFISSSISTAIWELFCPIVIGVVVTYGLFSSKNDNEHVDIKTESGSTFDHAQSYIAKYLHVPSVYDDEDSSPVSHDDDDRVRTNTNDDNKVQTWSSQYCRNQPSIVVVDDDKTSRVVEKPLLLPVRSLKSRVCDESNVELMNRSDSRIYNKPSFSSKTNGALKNEGKYVSSDENRVSKVYNRSNSSPISGGFSNEMKKISRTGSGKSRLAIGNEFGYSDEGGGGGGGGGGGEGLSRSLSRNIRKYGMLVDDEKNNEVIQSEETTVLPSRETTVLPSRIPWPSRSGRMEINGTSLDYGSLEELGSSQSMRSRSSKSSRSSSSSASGSSCSSPTMLSSSPVSSPKKVSAPPFIESESFAKINEDLGRKIVYSSRLPPPPPPLPPPPMYRSRLMKTSSAIEHDHVSRNIGRENIKTNVVQSSPMGKSVRTVTRETNGDDGDETDYEDLTDTDDGSESEDEIYSEAPMNGKTEKVEKEDSSNSFVDESPDVDKKADEFIAKFREQIRLQRIESIKKTAGQLKRNGMR